MNNIDLKDLIAHKKDKLNQRIRKMIEGDLTECHDNFKRKSQRIHRHGIRNSKIV